MWIPRLRETKPAKRLRLLLASTVSQHDTTLDQHRTDAAKRQRKNGRKSQDKKRERTLL
jgi:hypothetical protein